MHPFKAASSIKARGRYSVLDFGFCWLSEFLLALLLLIWLLNDCLRSRGRTIKRKKKGLKKRTGWFPCSPWGLCSSFPISWDRTAKLLLRCYLSTTQCSLVCYVLNSKHWMHQYKLVVKGNLPCCSFGSNSFFFPAYLLLFIFKPPYSYSMQSVQNL